MKFNFTKNIKISCSGIDNVHTYYYILFVRFEWANKKNRENIKKHGVSFKEAQEVFNDPLHLSKLDKRFGYLEERWITVGLTSIREIVVVANLFFNSEGEKVIRIISARRATPRERNQYEKYE
jgi:uncharacterized DUF497 family protein